MAPGRFFGLCLSLLIAAGSRAAAAPPRQPFSDARLEQLVQRFAGDDKKIEAAFRKAGLRRVLPRLVQMQRRTPKNYELSFDLAFTLAYLGVDYRQNVRRLIALDELWDRGDPRWRQYVSDGSDKRDDIPGLVDALYRHNHDLALLRILFSWRLDGGPAEGLASDHVHLLTDHNRRTRWPAAFDPRQHGAILVR